MNEKLEKDLIKAIDEQLPSIVGTTLKERLAQLEEYSQQIKGLTKEIEDYKKRIKRLEEMNSSLLQENTKLLNRENALDEKAKLLEGHDRKVWEAELKARESEKRADLASQWANKIFNPPTTRRLVDIQQQTAVDHRVNDKGYSNPYTTPLEGKSGSETETQE